MAELLIGTATSWTQIGWMDGANCDITTDNISTPLFFR